MCSPSAPTPPDPAETAGAQTATNVSTAVAQQALNNVNQVTPFGDLSYDQTGTFQFTDPNTGNVFDIPTYTQTQTLSPQQQAILNQNQGAQLKLSRLANEQSKFLRNHLNEGIDQSALPQGGSAAGIVAPEYQRLQSDLVNGDLGASGNIVNSVPTQNFNGQIADAGQITNSYGTDFSQDRRRVEDALFSRLEPQLDRSREELRTNLVNQGLREGTEAFDRAFNRFGEQSNDARMQAILAGGQEQSRLAGLEAQRAGFENAAQSQLFGQNQAQTNSTLQAQQAQQQADLAAGAFANAAQNQGFNELLARGQFDAGVTGQNNAARASDTAFNNDASTQSLQNQLALASRQDADRANALNEAFSFQNQPINQITALLGSGQVTQPNFTATNPAQLATVDRAGLDYAAYQNQLAAHNAQVAQNNSLFGGLLGLGGNIATAGIAGGLFG